MENVQPDSRKLGPAMARSDSAMGIVSLPLRELSNQAETPGPMSVLEWRRAVWFEVQSLNDQSYTTQAPCRRSPSRISRHTSTNSDSEDLTDKPDIGRPSRPSSRHRKRLTTMPLIDLSQPTDSDGRPIQFEAGRAQLVSQSNKPKKRMMAAPDIEQRHREAMRRLQAEATEHLIYAEWEANHQRNNHPQFDQPNLHRTPSRRAPLQKISDFARKSVSNLSVRTTIIESPSRTIASRSNTFDKSRSSAPKTPESSKKHSTRFTQMIKKFGSIRRSPSTPKMFSPDSEASMSRKSLLSSFRFSASTSAFHP